MSNVIIVVNKVTLIGIVDKTFLETIFPKNNPFRMPLPSGLCRRCSKDRQWTNEYSSPRNIQGNPLPSRNSVRSLLQVPMPNSVQSFPAIIEEAYSQSN